MTAYATVEKLNTKETAQAQQDLHEQSSRVFVTGGTGLIGSHLIEALLRNNYTVAALYRKHNPHVTHHKLNWIKGDILDIPLLEEIMCENDTVYHCAAVVDFKRSNRQMLHTNIEGTANVVNAALTSGVKKLCYVSSVAALDYATSGEVITEAAKRSGALNKSTYGKSKHRAEMEVWRGIAEGLNAVIVNPSIVLGEADWNSSSTKIFKAAYEEFPYFSEGATGFTDVKDVVKAMTELMNSDISGERFIVSAENLKYKDVFTAIAKAFNKKPPRKKINRFVTSMVWRFEALKSKLTGKEPLLTRDTADAAHAVRCFDNSKLLSLFPSFQYTPISETIKRVCAQLTERYGGD